MTGGERLTETELLAPRCWCSPAAFETTVNLIATP